MVRRGAACLVVVSAAVAACSGGERTDIGSSDDRSPGSSSPGSSPSVAVSVADDRDVDGFAPVARVVDGLQHVSTIEFALGSVWAVTSSRPDVFSPGELTASVVRIDPVTGAADTAVSTSGIEPTLAEAGGRLWVKTADELVALDESGDRVASVPIRLRSAGDLAGTDRLLWATVNQQDRVVAIDTATGRIVHSVETGRFPAGPTIAFGRVWVPSLIDHAVTIVEPQSGAEPLVSTHPVAEDLKFAIPVTTTTHGDEVWFTNDDGDVHAVSAEADRLGEVRRVALDRAVNSLVVLDDVALLLPTWGTRVVAFDLHDEAEVAEIDIDSIPFRAHASHGLFWVSGDGSRELLTVVDPATSTVVAQFRAGTNESTTTGPRQPITVDDEIWVPNRGSSSIFIVAAPTR